jgi:hypothetical protein
MSNIMSFVQVMSYDQDVHRHNQLYCIPNSTFLSTFFKMVSTINKTGEDATTHTMDIKDENDE